VSHSIDDILTPEFGAALRQAREAKGLRLEDVAAKLRIQLHYLHAMETGNLKALPPPPYRSAFVKQYAKLVGVSLVPPAPIPPPPVKTVPEVAADVAKATVEAVQSASKATESAVKKSVSQVKDAFDELTSRELWEEAEQVRRERLGLETSAKPEPTGLNIKPAATERRSYTPPPTDQPPEVAQAEDEAYEDVYPSKMSNTSKIIVGFLVVATCVILYLIFFNTTSKEIQIVGQSQPVVPEIVKEDTVADTVAPVSAVGDSMILTLTAKEQVWVSITPDDRTGYRGMLEAGMSKTFVAANQYLLYLGNQHALDIMFDGRRLSQLPSIPNSKIVVRGLVLTRDKVYTDTASSKPAVPAPPVVKVEDTVKKSPPPAPKRKEPEVKRFPGPVKLPVLETPVPKVDTSGKVGE
jgi:transcriptional regulator with XRE-family HTH domain